MLETFLHKPSHCPNCKELLTASEETREGGREGQPEPGDFSVCWYCGAILEYTPTLELVDARLDDLAEMLSEDPSQFHHLIAVRNSIQQRISN
jgi:hypothetical protein